jgi:GGDEF domain-containing protein
VTIDEHRIHLSLSVGLSTFPSDGADLATLLWKADCVMYDGKVRKPPLVCRDDDTLVTQLSGYKSAGVGGTSNRPRSARNKARLGRALP